MIEETKEPGMGPIVRTTIGLRDALFEEMEMLREGRSSAAKSTAVAKLGNAIIASVRMELEVRRFLQTAPFPQPQEALSALGPPIELGEPGGAAAASDPDDE